MAPRPTSAALVDPAIVPDDKHAVLVRLLEEVLARQAVQSAELAAIKATRSRNRMAVNASIWAHFRFRPIG
jgi:hypothetical protein